MLGKLGRLSVLLRSPTRVGYAEDTGLTRPRQLTPFRVAAPASAYRGGFRSPEAPTWRLHPGPDADSAANGGACGAAREASRRQGAPPRASRAAGCRGSSREAARLSARAGGRRALGPLRTPRRLRPGCSPTGEAGGRAGAAARVALSRWRAPPPPRVHARPLTDSGRGRGADPGSRLPGILGGREPGTRGGPATRIAWLTSAHSLLVV